MKLLRYGPPGHEKPGLLDNDGNIRDISRHRQQHRRAHARAAAPRAPGAS